MTHPTPQGHKLPQTDILLGGVHQDQHVDRENEVAFPPRSYLESKSKKIYLSLRENTSLDFEHPKDTK